jgi:hypothetical protein
MDIVYIVKCWYEIQEYKEVMVWYTSIYQPIWALGVRMWLWIQLAQDEAHWKTLNGHCIKVSCYIKSLELIDQLSDFHLLKKDLHEVCFWYSMGNSVVICMIDLGGTSELMDSQYPAWVQHGI